MVRQNPGNYYIFLPFDYFFPSFLHIIIYRLCAIYQSLTLWWSGVVVARWSRSTKLTYVEPDWYMYTGMGDRVRVQFPVWDIH